MNENEVKIYEDATWGKTGKDIIPSVFYQAYRVNGAWNSDDESLWYSFEPGEGIAASVISIIAKDAVLYAEGDTIPDGKSVGDVKEAAVTGSKIAATNSYTSGAGIDDTIKVEITASEALKTAHPFAHVLVDGREFDLNILSNPISLVMNKDHRITINWAADLKETFRVVVCR